MPKRSREIRENKNEYEIHSPNSQIDYLLHGNSDNDEIDPLKFLATGMPLENEVIYVNTEQSLPHSATALANPSLAIINQFKKWKRENPFYVGNLLNNIDLNILCAPNQDYHQRSLLWFLTNLAIRNDYYITILYNVWQQFSKDITLDILLQKPNDGIFSRSILYNLFLAKVQSQNSLIEAILLQLLATTMGHIPLDDDDGCFISLWKLLTSKQDPKLQNLIDWIKERNAFIANLLRLNDRGIKNDKKKLSDLHNELWSLAEKHQKRGIKNIFYTLAFHLDQASLKELAEKSYKKDPCTRKELSILWNDATNYFNANPNAIKLKKQNMQSDVSFLKINDNKIYFIANRRHPDRSIIGANSFKKNKFIYDKDSQQYKVKIAYSKNIPAPNEEYILYYLDRMTTEKHIKLSPKKVINGVECEYKKYIVSPYIKGEDLSTVLPSLNKLQQRIVAIKLIQQVENLHNKRKVNRTPKKGRIKNQIIRIIHADIKPKNIIIYINPNDIYDITVTLMDFDISKILYDNEEVYRGYYCGTVGYIAPEIAAKRNTNELADFTVKSDIYALGKVLCEGLEFNYFSSCSDMCNDNPANRPSLRDAKKVIIEELERNSDYQWSETSHNIVYKPTTIILPSEPVRPAPAFTPSFFAQNSPAPQTIASASANPQNPRILTHKEGVNELLIAASEGNLEKINELNKKCHFMPKTFTTAVVKAIEKQRVNVVEKYTKLCNQKESKSLYDALLDNYNKEIAIILLKNNFKDKKSQQQFLNACATDFNKIIDLLAHYSPSFIFEILKERIIQNNYMDFHTIVNHEEYKPTSAYIIGLLKVILQQKQSMEKFILNLPEHWFVDYNNEITHYIEILQPNDSPHYSLLKSRLNPNWMDIANGIIESEDENDDSQELQICSP